MSVVRFGVQLALFASVLAGSFFVFLVLKASKEVPEQTDRRVQARVVRGMEIVRQDFSEPVVGFGTARAARVHSIRPQVSGRIVRLSENFEEGKQVARGEVLFEVDDEDLSIAIIEKEALIQQARATLVEIQTQLGPIGLETERLAQERVDLEEQVRVVQSSIDLAREEVARLERLVESGAMSRSGLDAARIRLNQHEEAILAPRQRLHQIPALIGLKEEERKAIAARSDTVRAQVAVAEAALTRSRLDLSRCVVTSPIAGQLTRSGADKVVALGDFIAAGEDAGLRIHETNGPVEIPTPIDVALALWVRGAGRTTDGASIQDMLPRVGEVRVEWFRDPNYFWIGRLDRVKRGLDPTTRSLTAIVVVDDPGTEVVLGEKLPLGEGLFCRVVIPGFEHEDVVVIPRDALRPGNRVLLSRRGLLEVREVVPRRILTDRVVIEKGLEGGEILILSELPSAISGQRVEVRRVDAD